MTDNQEKINNIKQSDSPCVKDTWQSHFGAYFTKDLRAVFKLFTFPDVKNVQLEIKPRLKPSLVFNMNNTKECIWQLILDKGIISDGDRYRFIISFNNNESITVKDPCSMYQEEYFKWSKIYNHSLYNWKDKKWTCLDDKRRISRIFNDTNGLSPIQSLSVYELHIGTFTQEGTFKAAIDKLKYIADLKFNAIEIMPVENTYSFNWGYDGVDKYAPNHTYGSPDDLKELIDSAHNLGLNVIMDMVPNHLGPDIAELQKTGPYIECDNCFGYKFNFENKYSENVRNYIIGAALNWLINYHCDGLRVDMTKFVCSDNTLKQMAAEVHYHSPHSFLIAEDGRDNDHRVTRAFTPVENEENELNHSDFIDKILKNKVSISNLGFDSEWDFLFHKQIASTFLGAWDCRLKNICDFDYSLRDAQTRVKYMMSHDEIGNVDGTRFITKILANELNLNEKICECCHNIKCKRIAHASHRILCALVNGQLEKMSDTERKKFYSENFITDDISVEKIHSAFINAYNMHKTALGKVYSIPGPKMVFQGDEEADLSYFKFFRKFSSGPEPCLREKGYEPGLSAFLDSKLGSVVFSEKYLPLKLSMREYMRDLNQILISNSSLQNGNIEKTIVHEYSDIHAIYSKNNDSEIFSISNFSNKSYSNNYGILFPKGNWVEILNSDDKKYSGTGNYKNENLNPEPYKYISLSAYSISFFKSV